MDDSRKSLSKKNLNSTNLTASVIQLLVMWWARGATSLKYWSQLLRKFRIDAASVFRRRGWSTVKKTVKWWSLTREHLFVFACYLYQDLASFPRLP